MVITGISGETRRIMFAIAGALDGEMAIALTSGRLNRSSTT